MVDLICTPFYKHFKIFFQEHKLFANFKELNLTLNITIIRQQKNQLVSKLILRLNELENQVVPLLTSWKRWDYL